MNPVIWKIKYNMILKARTGAEIDVDEDLWDRIFNQVERPLYTSFQGITEEMSGLLEEMGDDNVLAI